MPRSYVLMVHGVGKHDPASWSTPWKDALIKALRQYAPFDSKSAEEIEAKHLCFVPMSYDVVFETFRQRWQSLAGALANNDVIAEGELVDALTWIADEDAKTQQLFWDYVLDAVLWYGFPLARAAVQSKVAEQVLAAFGRAAKEGGTAHVLAHSLGTSVVHDTLVGLVASKRLPPSQKRLQSVSMLANTGRLLRAWKDVDKDVGLSAYDPYNSALRPGPSAVTSAYLNFRHQIDPITWPLRFAPTNWSGYREARAVNFKDPLLVHDSTHYLANPKVHLPILRAIIGDPELGTEQEREQVWQEFEKDHPLTKDDLFSDLKTLFKASDERLDVKKLAQFWTHAFKALQK